MVKSLQQLRQEKQELLVKAKARQVFSGIIRHRLMERKRLKAEITALKNPGSVTAKRVAKKIAKQSGKILFKNAVVFAKHLGKVAAEQNMPTRNRMRKKTAKARRKRR